MEYVAREDESLRTKMKIDRTLYAFTFSSVPVFIQEPSHGSHGSAVRRRKSSRFTV